jgi:3-isopropylmalate/(R)-2-methylmalate dehydratase small subunit
MAVWALEEFGIRCVIAQSFGDIFYANCLQNGLLPIRLDAAQIESLAGRAALGERLCVDLHARTIQAPGIDQIAFDFPDDRREALLEGIDEIDQTTKLNARILAFQHDDVLKRPWVYVEPCVQR